MSHGHHGHRHHHISHGNHIPSSFFLNLFQPKPSTYVANMGYPNTNDSQIQMVNQEMVGYLPGQNQMPQYIQQPQNRCSRQNLWKGFLIFLVCVVPVIVIVTIRRVQR